MPLSPLARIDMDRGGDERGARNEKRIETQNTLGTPDNINVLSC
jgi:hypothetical protein